MNKKIIVQLEVEGVHRWQGCNIEEVLYLKDMHRHNFMIRIEKSVKDSDREIEFIKFKHDVIAQMYEEYYDTIHSLCNFVDDSCEMIAEWILNKFDCDYVEVLEDGENGGAVWK